MNRVVVIRAAAGLAPYLEGARRLAAVVIGYDARHKSDVFARDTAEVMAGAGLRAVVLPRPLPTPVLAFAIRHLGADAGVMVTASHNPPQDNGYKVYLGDGSQIVPPADAEIAAEIDGGRPAGRRSRRGDGWETLGDDVLDAYLDRVAGAGRPGVARATSGSSTRRCTASAATSSSPPSPRAGFAAPARGRASRPSPDPDFPHRRVPQPGGAGRDGPRVRRRPVEHRRRPRDRQRPGRRPVRRRRPRPAADAAGGCCAATRSARCSPPTWCAGTPPDRHLRRVDRLLVAARPDRRGARPGRTRRR